MLAARVRRLVAAEVRDRVVVVRAIDVEHSRFARFPRAVHDLLEDVARVELAHHLARARVDQVVGLAGIERDHERIGDRHGDVEIRHLREVVLAVDEIQDVRMIHAQDAHIRAAPGAALLHDVGRADDVVLGTQPGEREARPATRLMHQCHRPEGVVNAGAPVREGVFHREHEAGGQLAERAAGVHQGGRIGHPHPCRHELEEHLGEALDGPI